ncbi:UDP-glucose 4-epimerase [Aaosphaeria arxii CBS 175.79]|uniref:UDP-glucose 4-epimerase n=1 Tax=Aaosphaeria arxii CBS 175.79 TaxID=1450172 RepID=A0A6A5XXY3_9PLEO|nr:UDP-glucose 4-epimerase [Aaosphaeria arxii CBS 175.79]KAF2017687.1 UDP-glucose 4-epimerase [Aaosphaeria arxii CBS 175.79]
MNSINSSEDNTPASSPRTSRSSTPGTEKDDLFDSLPAANNGKYVLVTGGLGFIGSHTVLELLKAGHNVAIVDDLSNSYSDVFSRIIKAANRHFDTHGGICPKAEFHNTDYRNKVAMSSLLDSHATGPNGSSNISGVIHFAAYKAVEESIRQPLKYYLNNINGLVDFIVLLEEYNIKTFIFSSSAAVYGNLADGSQDLREEHCVHEEETYLHHDGTDRRSQPGYTGITSPYGRTKFFGEAILSDIAKSDPSWTIIGLRYFNPVGCDVSGLLGEDPRGVPSNLLPVVVKVVTGQIPEICVYGNDWDTTDGTAIRDFIHVTDLARGHNAALFAALNGRICHGFRTFNLGGGTGYSVLEVISTMEAVTQRPVPTKIVGRRDGDVQSSVAAADRANIELGWSTKETLFDACQDTWNYLKLKGY